MYFNFVLIEFVFGTVTAIICKHAGIDQTSGLAAGSIIGSILALIIWFRFFSPEYRWKPERHKIIAIIGLLYIKKGAI